MKPRETFIAGGEEQCIVTPLEGIVPELRFDYSANIYEFQLV